MELALGALCSQRLRVCLLQGPQPHTTLLPELPCEPLLSPLKRLQEAFPD